jgi:Family of unknown function (DUF6314)
VQHVTLPAVPVLAFLLGSWRAERELADHLTGKTGSWHGEATFTSQPGSRELAYREDGQLSFGGWQSQAGRSLSYLGRADGGADVCFADGRPFYRLRLSGCGWQASHPCGPDNYALTGRLLADDCYTERWLAKGPGKDYTIMTTFRRMLPGA